MALAAGDKRGPYEILEPIGKGGMGEVYRARDTRVGRDVAIKISAERFSERFEREAQAIASLNHPNICTLYDVGPDFLVMELVDGDPLQGPLPLDTALDYARQIAAALEAAHDRGIVHRDLKPANIKITPQGVVKVLDFGLAKVMPAASSGVSLANSPTLSMAATEAGIILGTAAYMAPEQARGQTVDKRADIWAFGVVLYEMLTGKRLFEGEDLTDTLASVVRDKPDLSAAPPEVRRVLDKCLEKDPKKRLRDISGVQLLLEASTPSTTPPAVPATPVRMRGWPWGVAALATAALAFVSVVHFRERPLEVTAVNFPLDPPKGFTYVNPYGGIAVSPDGRHIVFAARGKAGPASLWLRPLDSQAARPLPGTEGGTFPAWSPDSRSIIFFADGKMKRIEITGGAPLTIADAEDVRVTPTGTWNRDGVVLLGGVGGLQRTSASGGNSTLLTKIDSAKQEAGHGYPQFLPDGNRFLFFVDSGDPAVQGVYASSLDRPEERRHVLRTGAKAVYVPPRASFPGYLVWMQDQTLVAQRFDEAKLQVEGDPVSVAENVGVNPGSPIRAGYWTSESGPLVYFSSANVGVRSVVWLDRNGKPLREAAPDGNYSGLALSPGYDRIALEQQVPGSSGRGVDIWVGDVARNVLTRLTFDAADDRWPVWSPDGKQIVFASNRGGGFLQLFRKDASGAGVDERLTDSPNPKIPLDWSRDGRYILYREDSPVTGRDLLALPLTGDRKPIAIVNTRFNESTGAISPDGRWIAYTSADSGTYQLYVQAFPGSDVSRAGSTGAAPQGRWQISNGYAYDVKWRGDGKELYYETNDQKMMVAGIQSGPDGVRADTPRILFTAGLPAGGLHNFDVTRDGDRFVMILNSPDEASAQRYTVVTDWQATLRR